jgi:RNA polymerase sigma factor (sigma-70 family)
VNNKKARDKIILENLGLVRYAAKRYRRMPCYEDLLQEGTIGLIQAADKFDPSLGISFSSLAVPYIRGYICHYFRGKFELIRSPVGKTPLTVGSLSFSKEENSRDLEEVLIDPACQKDEQLEDLLEYATTLPEKERQLLEGLMRGDRIKDQIDKIGVSPVTMTRWKKKIIQSAKDELL